MRKHLIVVTLIVAVSSMLSVCAPVREASIPEDHSFVIVVDARQDLPGLDTGIDLAPSDTVTVTASGEASFGPGSIHSCISSERTVPDGHRITKNGTLCPPKIDSFTVFPSAPVGTLLAKIGSSNWFTVGTRFSSTIQSSGRLFFLYNDVHGLYGNNSGTYQPNVRVVQVGVEGYYAVLGDSYSAGVGNPPYESDSPYFSLGCGRSPYAYGPKLSAAVPTLGKLAFIACGGAVTDDFYSFTGHVSQLYQLGILPNVVSVTLTISGNDIGFQNIIETCIKSEPPQGCKKDLELAEAIERRLAGLAGTRKNVQTPTSKDYPTGRTIVPLTKLLKDIYEGTSIPKNARWLVGVA